MVNNNSIYNSINNSESAISAGENNSASYSKYNSEPYSNRRLRIGDIVWAEPNANPIGNEEQKKRPYVLVHDFNQGRMWEIAPLARNNATRAGTNKSYHVHTSAYFCIRQGLCSTGSPEKYSFCNETWRPDRSSEA